MKINWAVRFKNPTWLLSFVAFVLSTVYQALAMFEIAPAVPQESIAQVASAVVQLLTLMGILVDPTTAGIGDSKLAMTYTKPKK